MYQDPERLPLAWHGFAVPQHLPAHPGRVGHLPAAQPITAHQSELPVTCHVVETRHSDAMRRPPRWTLPGADGSTATEPCQLPRRRACRIRRPASCPSGSRQFLKIRLRQPPMWPRRPVESLTITEPEIPSLRRLEWRVREHAPLAKVRLPHDPPEPLTGTGAHGAAGAGHVPAAETGSEFVQFRPQRGSWPRPSPRSGLTPSWRCRAPEPHMCLAGWRQRWTGPTLARV